MNTFDFSPLFRSSVGFDRLARLAETAVQMGDATQSYPPYNIVKSGEDTYSITLAVAGFDQDELAVEVKEDVLTVTGRKAQEDKAEQGETLYRGIAARDFLRRFQLADHVKVTGATLENGLLTVFLRREVPEESRPRTIPISSGSISSGKERPMIEGERASASPKKQKAA